MLPSFYGVSATVFASTLTSFEAQIAPDPNARSFVVQSLGHVVLAGTFDVAATSALPGWLSSMVSDDPTWTSESL